MLLIWCVHSACDPIFGQRPTINSLYVQLWLRTYMCSTTKSQLHLTWLEVWWSLGSYQSMFHHAMRGDTLSHSIETIYDLWWSFGLTHPCSTTLWAPDHPTSIIMRQCKDKGHISHPQEKPQSTSTGGRGGRGSRWVHYIGGGGGGACQTWIIYLGYSPKGIQLFPLIKGYPRYYDIFLVNHPRIHPPKQLRDASWPPCWSRWAEQWST